MTPADRDGQRGPARGRSPKPLLVLKGRYDTPQTREAAAAIEAAITNMAHLIGQDFMAQAKAQGRTGDPTPWTIYRSPDDITCRVARDGSLESTRDLTHQERERIVEFC